MIQTFYRSLSSAALAGVLALLPIGLLVFVVWEAIDIVIGVLEPVAMSFGLGQVLIDPFDKIVAGIVVLVICIVLGLIVQTRVGGAISRFIGESVTRRLPFVSEFTNLARSVAGVRSQKYQLAVADVFGADVSMLSLLIEEERDGYCTLFVPFTPVGTMGVSVVVPADRVRLIEGGMGRALRICSGFGSGTLKSLQTAPGAGQD